MLPRLKGGSSGKQMKRPLQLSLQVSAVLVLLNAAVSAQTPRGWDQCVGHESPDLVIEGCSEIIDEGQQAPAILSTAHNNRGVAYKVKGEYDLALKDYDLAIELNPNAASHFNNRGVLYRLKHDYDRAIADYDEAIWLKSDYIAAFYNRALAYVDKGDYGRALADFGVVLQFNPKSALALYARGWMLLKKGDAEAGNADIAAAKAINPNIAEQFDPSN
jgi:tetratricopeptide (TPR) repeat protein